MKRPFMSKESLRRRLAALAEMRKNIDRQRSNGQFYEFAMRQFWSEMLTLVDDLYEYGHGERPRRKREEAL